MATVGHMSRNMTLCRWPWSVLFVRLSRNKGMMQPVLIADVVQRQRTTVLKRWPLGTELKEGIEVHLRWRTMKRCSSGATLCSGLNICGCAACRYGT